jgi:hypothetical protein
MVARKMDSQENEIRDFENLVRRFGRMRAKRIAKIAEDALSGTTPEDVVTYGLSSMGFPYLATHEGLQFLARYSG